MSFLQEVRLLEPSAVREQLPNDQLQAFFDRHCWSTRNSKTQKRRSQQVQDWLSWCRQQKKRVRVVEADVPRAVLPPKMAAILSDMKVGGDRRRPDDGLYNAHGDLRERVARGNSVLFINDHETNESYYDNVIFALKKFTGGMGDEDEEQPDDNKTWMDYFLRPVHVTSRIVCTEKANGEAAHMAVRVLRGKFYLIAGSKNVHMLLKDDKDLTHYTDGRYQVARNVASAALSHLSTLSPDQCALLLSFMHHTAVTAVFEILQPDYQHVVNLSHLTSPKLLFITWTLPYGEEDETDSLCALAPDVVLTFAEQLGLEGVHHEVVAADEAETRMAAVRRGCYYEGEVLFFLDSAGNVIGLLKKKTAWYVVLRAIREKACAAMFDFKKNPSGYSNSQKAKKLETRLQQIQNWLNFDDACLKAWQKLGTEFLVWLVRRDRDENVRGIFPVLWKTFLDDRGFSDKVECNID